MTGQEAVAAALEAAKWYKAKLNVGGATMRETEVHLITLAGEIARLKKWNYFWKMSAKDNKIVRRKNRERAERAEADRDANGKDANELTREGGRK